MLGGGRVKVMRQRGAWNPPPWAKIELCNETLFGCKRARDLVENLHFAEYLWDTAALKKIKTFFSAVLNFPLYFLTPFIYISYGSFPLFSYPIIYEESRVEAFYYVYVTGIGVIGSPCASRAGWPTPKNFSGPTLQGFQDHYRTTWTEVLGPLQDHLDRGSRTTTGPPIYESSFNT